MNHGIDQKRCPICGKGNACEASHECWCGKEIFPSGLLELVPAEFRDKACICNACLKQFKADAMKKTASLPNPMDNN
ncbi:cysteine-rich CWC family protein [Paenibacillus rhizovicinus]|uniref:Cysteine-rich CWC family protein n=1 Tax=Paenibacillus rhizovicinus TaxID=2704463 RepID=A0A6C0P847_9BACL|nr:cysteine-rich CWC family protein [Paenibacillus rhizovicinus]QHW34718.1 cysteine-rich CWC family protein [Paenibacillus rhizovicinus]